MSRRALLHLKETFSRTRLRPSPPYRISRSPAFSPIAPKSFSSNGDFSSQNLIQHKTNPTVKRSPEDNESSGDFSSPSLIQRKTNPTAKRSPEDDESSADDDVSTEELKKRIGKFLAGSMEEADSIFEAILQRKLSGKYNDTDEELMAELRSNVRPPSSEIEDEHDLTTSDDYDDDDDDGDFDTSDEDSDDSSK